MDEYTQYLSARGEVMLSYYYWKACEQQCVIARSTAGASEKGLGEAIYWAENSFSRIARLDPRTRGQFILDVYDLLAYELAMRCEGKDCERALGYADYIRKNSGKYASDKHHYDETYWWVSYRCGRLDAHNEAIAKIKALVTERKYDSSWREKYGPNTRSFLE